MSSKVKVETLITIIDKALRDLSKEIGASHIDAFIIDGTVLINDLTDLKNKKIDYFKGEEQVSE